MCEIGTDKLTLATVFCIAVVAKNQCGGQLQAQTKQTNESTKLKREKNDKTINENKNENTIVMMTAS